VADDRRLVISTDPSLSAEDITRRTFGTAFRGWDPNEVRSYLAKVAKELATTRQRIKQLERQLGDVESQAAHPELDEATITSALGEEAARILRTAREAGADIKGRAEESVERILRQAHEEAARIRSEAEAMLADRFKEADEAADAIRQAADDDGQRVIEEARLRGREMLHEAQALRSKVLGDLARRRKLAQVQVAQLRAGRERLLEAYRVVRRTMDEVSDELQRADAEARLAAEQAALRMSEAAELSVEELSAGLSGTAAVEVETGSAPPADALGPAPSLAPSSTAPALPVEPAAEPAVQPATEPPAEQPAAPAAAEAKASAKPVGERTSSSLRVLRGPKPEPAVITAASGAELVVVEVPSEIEAVRIIAPSPARPDPGEPERAEIVADAAPVAPDEATPVTPPPAPESGGDEPPAAEAAAEQAAEEAPADEKSADETAPDETAPDEPAPDEPPAAEAAPADEQPADEAPIDDLFARIRADRAEAVAKAQRVLHDATVPQDAPGVAATRPAAEETPAVASIDDGLVRRRDGELEPVEVSLTRRLKRALQDDQNELLDRLRSHRGPVRVESLLPPAAEHAERFRRVGQDLLAQAARVGASFAGSVVPSSPDLTDLVDDVADAVTRPLRARLQRGLGDALAEGDDEAVLVERVGAAYREWKTQRIERLATDQIVAAFSRGFMGATPPGTALRWVVSDIGGPCPDCDDNALAGVVPSGEAYPTGPVHPPAHPGCRCLLVPAPA